MKNLLNTSLIFLLSMLSAMGATQPTIGTTPVIKQTAGWGNGTVLTNLANVTRYRGFSSSTNATFSMTNGTIYWVPTTHCRFTITGVPTATNVSQTLDIILVGSGLIVTNVVDTINGAVTFGGTTLANTNHITITYNGQGLEGWIDPGVIAVAQLPAETGDVTRPAGSAVNTIAASVTLVTPNIGAATGTSLTMGSTNVVGALAGKAASATTFSGYGISTTSANLLATLTDETGTGVAVFGTSPTLTTPNIGVATATSLTMGSTNVIGAIAGKQASLGFTPVNIAGDTMTGSLSVTALTNTALTASRAVVTDANKASASSATTAAEIAFVNGVTSAIQTQFDVISPRTNLLQFRIYYESEFFSSVAFAGDANFGSSQTGSGTIAAGTGTAGHYGIWILGSGATTGASIVTSGAASVILANGVVRYAWLIQAPNGLSDGTDTYTLGIGLTDTSSALPVDGVYFTYNQTQDTHWQYATASNSTRTTTASTVTVAVNTWYLLEAEINAAATSADFYINRTYAGSQTTNIPTGAGRETGMRCWLSKTAGTTIRAINLDFSSFYCLSTTQRY